MITRSLAPTVGEKRAVNLWWWAGRLVFALALLILIGHLLVYVHYAIGLMRFPFDYDQGEGFELVDTMLFSEGKWPYRNNEVYPFYASNYPPLFHVILVPFVWLFGPAYWYGRLAGFAATLITAAAIGRIVYREERHRALAVLSGLAFLASNYVYHVGPLFRQHMTMVMFETLCVLVLAHAPEMADPRRRRTLLLGLGLLLAAGYTKQHAFATAIAVFGFLFLRHPRRSLAWGAVFAAAGGGLFWWINVSTNGAWWDNIIAANVNPYLPAQFTGLFKQWFRLHAPLILMAGAFAVYELYFARLSLYTVWWVFAGLATTLAGKWGAGDSYFATAIAATCVLAGRFAARTVRGGWTAAPDHPCWRRMGGVRAVVTTHRARLVAAAGLIIPALYVYYGLSVIHLPTQGALFGPLAEALGLESSYPGRYEFYDSAGWVQGYATIGHVPTSEDTANGWRIVDIIRTSGKPAMSEEAAFSIRAGVDVVTNPTQLKNLYENKLFDPTNLVNAIRRHEFGVVIFRAQFYPPPVLDAVYEAYYPSETIRMNGFDYEIWRPGPPWAERETFAANLSARESFTQPISLPVDQADRWLAHALWVQGWQRGPSTNTAEGCFSGIYSRDEQLITAEVCPAVSGAMVALNRE